MKKKKGNYINAEKLPINGYTPKLTIENCY